MNEKGGNKKNGGPGISWEWRHESTWKKDKESSKVLWKYPKKRKGKPEMLGIWMHKK